MTKTQAEKKIATYFELSAAIRKTEIQLDMRPTMVLERKLAAATKKRAKISDAIDESSELQAAYSESCDSPWDE